VLDQGELGNVAVTAAWRGRGVGERLVEECCARGSARRTRGLPRGAAVQHRGAATVRTLGFRPVGRRRNYYQEPVEDALVMRRLGRAAGRAPWNGADDMCFPAVPAAPTAAHPALRGWCARPGRGRATSSCRSSYVTGTGVRRPVGSMPGVFQTSVDELRADAREAPSSASRPCCCSAFPATRTSTAPAVADDGVVQEAVRALKRELPDLVVITDVCLCEYTSHGHCGVLRRTAVDNDATLELLARQALSHARAGADIVAPSDMMDGRVGAIRRHSTPRASPTPRSCPTPRSTRRRSTARSATRRRARRSSATGAGYQMDPANAEEALREVRLDIAEGADMSW
jgi:porphobilinogen synthase